VIVHPHFRWFRLSVARENWTALADPGEPGRFPDAAPVVRRRSRWRCDPKTGHLNRPDCGNKDLRHSQRSRGRYPANLPSSPSPTSFSASPQTASTFYFLRISDLNCRTGWRNRGFGNNEERAMGKVLKGRMRNGGSFSRNCSRVDLVRSPLRHANQFMLSHSNQIHDSDESDRMHFRIPHFNRF
jgi:hypothetical protein